MKRLLIALKEPPGRKEGEFMSHITKLTPLADELLKGKKVTLIQIGETTRVEESITELKSILPLDHAPHLIERAGIPASEIYKKHIQGPSFRGEVEQTIIIVCTSSFVGEEVGKLVSQNLPVNAHTPSFPSGFYLYRISAIGTNEKSSLVTSPAEEGTYSEREQTQTTHIPA